MTVVVAIRDTITGTSTDELVACSSPLLSASAESTVRDSARRTWLSVSRVVVALERALRGGHRGRSACLT